VLKTIVMPKARRPTTARSIHLSTARPSLIVSARVL
jgi:hypothetical protein